MLDAPFTANARALGSRQRDASQKITGQFGLRNTVDMNIASGALSQAEGPVAPAVGTAFTGPYVIMQFDSSRVVRTSTETRGANAAYHPRIHA